MAETFNDHIMTFNKGLEAIEGVKGAATIVLYDDGRIDLILHPQQDPADYVQAVKDIGEVFFEPEDYDEEPEGLWLLIDEQTGHA